MPAQTCACRHIDTLHHPRSLGPLNTALHARNTRQTRQQSTMTDFSTAALFDVSERVALVTGGGTGIGLMCAQALATNGAKVYIVGRHQDRLDTAVKSHGQGLKGQLIPVVADISDKKSLDGLIAEIESKEKCLCILINNAGVAGTSDGPQADNVTGKDGATEGDTAVELKKSLWGGEYATWTDIYRTNTAAMYFTSIGFLPLLERATEHHKGYSGCIINICSISGTTKKSQNHFSYNASKGAAIHVNLMLAAALGERGIKVRVNALSPGVFPSEMTESSSDATNKSHLEKKEFEGIPARRPGHERDMANACLFLATNQYTNGQNVNVDGGWLLVN